MQLLTSQSGDTVELVWASFRSNSPGWNVKSDPYDVVAVDSCVPVILVDGANRKVKYLRCINLPYLGSIVLPATGTVAIEAIPPQETIIRSLGKPITHAY